MRGKTAVQALIDRSASVFVLLDESGYEASHEILLAARQRNSLLENALEPADGTRSALLDGLITEDVLDFDAERFGEQGQRVGAGWQWGGFPEADGFGRDAHELGELGLAEASGFAERDEAGGLFWTWLGETPRHAGSVRVHLRDLWI
jgi:hypothetical protein